MLGRKKGKRNNKKSTSIDKDLSIIFMVVISILLFIIIYSESGMLGKTISPILGGILGGVKYIIPIGFLAIALAMIKDKKNYVFSKVSQYLIFLGCVASILTIYQISKETINIENNTFSKILEATYSLGEKNIGGGVIGILIAYPLIKLIGMFGSAILVGGVAVVLLVFTFGIRPTEIFLNITDKLQEMKDEREEELEELRIRREERRKNKSEKIKETHVRLKPEKEQESIIEDQITINLNESNESHEKIKGKGLFRKTEALVEEKEEINPNVIEGNLFKQEEEIKENKVKEVLQLEHSTIMVDDENYEYPPVELLQQEKVKAMKGGKKALTDTATKLQKTLYSFGVSAKVENVSVGPAITRYELKPAEGVRVSKIAKLADDIALNLAAESIRIEAPIPGKQAVGIEIPNSEKEVVHLRDIIETNQFEISKSKLSMALGKNVAGEAVIADIAKMPHVLIAGSTGSGKSVCINTLITSIIYKSKPSEVKMVMIDPKVVELSVYNGIPHLLIPVVTDPRKAAGALAWAVQEMENRYQMFAAKGVRDLKGYNEALENEDLEGKMPQIVIIIDELADLMMVAAKDVEDAICRLAQKARAAGMHLVIATQRPSVDVITGIIKANVPSRIAFAVSSQIDSRTILDMAGAEKLLGKGDMLFYPIGASKPVRVQGAFVSDKEVEKIVDFLKSNGEVVYNEDIIESIENANKSDQQKDLEKDEEDDTDPFLNDAIESVIEIGQASTSFIQRRFKVGYARAGRIIDQMEARGIISGYEGSKPRKVLMSKERWDELNMMQAPQDNE